jgi:hypothetical protein
LGVESFDPGANALPLTREVVGELLEAAERLEADHFGLTESRVAELAAVARNDERADWATMASSLDTSDIVALIRLFTLAERLPGWEAGPRSPVIALAAELKGRDAYPADLTRWIKSHSDNRFLPYGSLMDRL